jgi:hypothetical protein
MTKIGSKEIPRCPYFLKFCVLRGQKSSGRPPHGSNFENAIAICNFLIFEIGFGLVDEQNMPIIDFDQKRRINTAKMRLQRGADGCIGQKMESGA